MAHRPGAHTPFTFGWINPRARTTNIIEQCYRCNKDMLVFKPGTKFCDLCSEYMMKIDFVPKSQKPQDLKEWEKFYSSSGQGH